MRVLKYLGCEKWLHPSGMPFEPESVFEAAVAPQPLGRKMSLSFGRNLKNHIIGSSSTCHATIGTLIPISERI